MTLLQIAGILKIGKTQIGRADAVLHSLIHAGKISRSMGTGNLSQSADFQIVKGNTYRSLRMEARAVLVAVALERGAE